MQPYKMGNLSIWFQNSKILTSTAGQEKSVGIWKGLNNQIKTKYKIKNITITQTKASRVFI